MKSGTLAVAGAIAIVFVTGLISIVKQNVNFVSNAEASSHRTEYIKCFSGGEIILEDTADGYVSRLAHGVFSFTSKTTGEKVEVTADCISIRK